MDWIREGARCQQIGGARRTGTIISDVWSGYVDIKWDSGRTETDWHISDIKQAEVR